MTHQARFEKFIKSTRPSWSLRQYSGGEYMDSRVDWAWFVWMEAVKL